MRFTSRRGRHELEAGVDGRDGLERLGRLLGVSAEAILRRREELQLQTRHMTPEKQLDFERWLAVVATAAEELGPRADPNNIIKHAQRLMTRRT